MSCLGHFGVVIDSGSYYTKAGFSGEAFPRAVFPTVLGRFRHSGIVDGLTPDVFFGDEALRRRGVSNLTWPVRRGMVQEWDNMEKIWYHTFYKALLVPPEEINVLLSLHPLTTVEDKVKIAEILFESLAVPALYLASSPSMILHATGRTTGLVWEAGAMSSYAAPVFEGFPLRNAITKSSVTGEVLNDVLQKQLLRVGYAFNTPLERDLLDKIKYKCCYVSRNYEEDMARVQGSSELDASYVLPDGKPITIREPRFQCPEVMFQPSLESLECPNVVDTICNSIDKCDLDYKPEFYSNIVMAGGSTMFTGLQERLTSELVVRTRALPEYKIKVDAPKVREFAAWAGGSIVSSLSSMKGFWLTRQDYEDSGSEKVQYAFF